MKVISTATSLGQAFKNAGRVREIMGVFVKHGYADLLHRMQLGRFIPQRYAEVQRFKQLPPAERLRLSFEELGTTFIKLGQLLASRPDLIPDAFVEEFEKLQDNVGVVPFSEIKAVIESELKSPLSEHFAEFEERPIAAASIAQVHSATLKSGAKVAVKVQRPGIEKVIANDVSILRGLALAMENYIPESRILNPTGLVEEFFKTILLELDFRIEANNIRRIKKNLSSLATISIPEVHTTLSTERMLVLEKFEGVRFSDREAILKQGIDPAEIVRQGSDAFFHMVMVDGLFHGDLHAGNLFVLTDGRIGIIDFGICGRLSRRVQDSILIMFTSIVDEDYDTLAAEYISLCPSGSEADPELLQKDLMDTISPYVGMPLGELNVGRLLLRSTAIATRHKLKVPRELMLLFRAILTIEALGKKLDPTFDLLPVGIRLARQSLSTRYSKERIMRDLIVIGRDLQGLAETTPRLLKRALVKWSKNGFAVELKIPELEPIQDSLRQSNITRVLQAWCLGWFALTITFIVLDKGPQLWGAPVAGLLSLAFAAMPPLYYLWILRKKKL